MKLVEILNALTTNGAAVAAIAAGVLLSICNMPGPATALITGGFALLQHNRVVSS